MHFGVITVQWVSHHGSVSKVCHHNTLCNIYIVRWCECILESSRFSECHITVQWVKCAITTHCVTSTLFCDVNAFWSHHGSVSHITSQWVKCAITTHCVTSALFCDVNAFWSHITVQCQCQCPWTLTAETERKIQTMEMRSFRRLLGISYREHITNEEVRSRIRQTIGPYKELLTIVKQRKLQWYEHITRSSGLAKTFLQGTVQGGRRRGRQRKRWEDNIGEWTGLGLSDTIRKVEEREEWWRLVVTSCGAPTVHKIMGQIDR